MKRYYLLGRKLSHSLSPFFQNMLFQRSDLQADYSLLEFEPEQATEIFQMLRAEAAGFNVTVPYKQLCMDFLDEISPEARDIGAVNTVVNQNGRLLGYNTDGQGFLASLGELADTLEDKEVLLLGAGGTARMLAMMLLQAGAMLTIYNRTFEKGNELARQLAEKYPARVQAAAQPPKGSFLVVNATSAGMYPHTEEMPLPRECLQGTAYAYDCVYNPLNTRFLEAAKRAGAKTTEGLAMLWHQGLLAQKIWGNEFTEEVLKETYAALRMEAQKKC